MNNFYLTKRALQNLEEIYNYSLENWGENKADEYLSLIYNNFNKIANNANLGELRKKRSTPFLMFPSGKHYIVYEPFKDGIIIITVLHQVRNIESIVQEFGSSFYNEIEELKSQLESK